MRIGKVIRVPGDPLTNIGADEVHSLLQICYNETIDLLMLWAQSERVSAFRPDWAAPLPAVLSKLRQEAARFALVIPAKRSASRGRRRLALQSFDPGQGSAFPEMR